MSEAEKQPVVTTQKNGLGTAALVLGIIGFVFAFIPFLDFGTGVIPLVGLILGIIGLTAKNKPKNMALAGTIVSGVAVLLTIIMVISYAALFFSAVNKSIDETNKANNAPVSVVYEVDGTSTDATVTYANYSNGNSTTQQATNQTLPFTKTVTGTKGWSGYTLSAMNGMNDTGDISCKITVDGTVVASQTSTGKFASVSCTSTSGDATTNQ